MEDETIDATLRRMREAREKFLEALGLLEVLMGDDDEG